MPVSVVLVRVAVVDDKVVVAEVNVAVVVVVLVAVTPLWVVSVRVVWVVVLVAEVDVAVMVEMVKVVVGRHESKPCGQVPKTGSEKGTHASC